MFNYTTFTGTQVWFTNVFYWHTIRYASTSGLKSRITKLLRSTCDFCEAGIEIVSHPDRQQREKQCALQCTIIIKVQQMVEPEFQSITVFYNMQWCYTYYCINSFCIIVQEMTEPELREETVQNLVAGTKWLHLFHIWPKREQYHYSAKIRLVSLFG